MLNGWSIMEGSITTLMEAVIGLTLAFGWFVYLRKKKKAKLKDLPKKDTESDKSYDNVV